MCTAGEARTRGACVSSVLCTRVLVCKAQGSERGRGSGEAEAWAAKAGAQCGNFFLHGAERAASIRLKESCDDA